MTPDKIRNIAIIAHVDHGKTTLVDKLLQQSGTFSERAEQVDRVMDNNDIEKERGITILAKNTAIHWKEHHVNIVDTPGHADFGGEVERILSMVDSVLLLVDAVDGPMPQTRFVTEKAFKQGLKPIVVVNKIDRAGARIDAVVDEVFDLFVNLNASDSQLDFPIVYASALQGYAYCDGQDVSDNMGPLLDLIINKVPPPNVSQDGNLQMQITFLDYSSYLGVIGVGKISNGSLKLNQSVSVVAVDGSVRFAKINQIFGHLGLERIPTNVAQAGDIVAVTGIENLTISETICDKDYPQGLPALSVDEPTISMIFQINDSPLVGQDGKLVTSRQLRDRLMQEALHNIAVQISDTENTEQFKVSGRGELQLAVLIETMRREGYELAISKPQVIYKKDGTEVQEPYEQLSIEVEEQHQGVVMERLGTRRAQLNNMLADGRGRIRLEYDIPARGLIGFHTEFVNLTSGSGILNHVFDRYDALAGKMPESRKNGVLIANSNGKASAYALWNLQPRGQLLIGPQTEVYEGMIVGIHSRANDLVVNVNKEKQLTNVRASGTDENIQLTPAIELTLEQAMSAIKTDELIEVTPKNIRLRKRYLKESDRKRFERENI